LDCFVVSASKRSSKQSGGRLAPVLVPSKLIGLAPNRQQLIHGSSSSTHTLICLLWSQGLQFSKQAPTFQETCNGASSSSTIHTKHKHRAFPFLHAYMYPTLLPDIHTMFMHSTNFSMFLPLIAVRCIVILTFCI